MLGSLNAAKPSVVLIVAETQMVMRMEGFQNVDGLFFHLYGCRRPLVAKICVSDDRGLDAETANLEDILENAQQFYDLNEKNGPAIAENIANIINSWMRAHHQQYDQVGNCQIRSSKELQKSDCA